MLGLAIIRVLREEDRAWKPVTILEASNLKKAGQDWDMGLSEGKAEVDMAVECTPEGLTAWMLGCPWEFHGWSAGD